MALSHIDEEGKARMIDVSDKPVTSRTAKATGLIQFPNDAFKSLEDGGFMTKKGSILDTAKIAGIQAAKNTSSVIPLTHNIPILWVQIVFNIKAEDSIIEVITAIKGEAKTGFEMEALHGTTVALLTIYDMTKALSHEIIFKEIKLIEKTGGKKDISPPK